MADSASKIKESRLRRHPRLVWRRIMRLWPLLVWVLIALIVVWMYAGTVHYGSITGVVETVSEDVAPIETSRLFALAVNVGDQVQPGDVVARMDPVLLNAKLAVEEAAALEAEQSIAGYQESILRMARQFESAISDAQADYLQERLRQSQSDAELAELKKELERRAGLLERKLIREEDVNILRPKIAALETAALAYPELIEAYRQRVETARKEYTDMRGWLALEKDEDIADAIMRKRQASTVILESAQQLRKTQLDGYALKTTRTGEVSRIYHAPGEVIAAGDPVVRIVARQSERIIGFVSELQLADIVVGHRMHVWNHGVAGRQRAVAVVESISPEIQALPGRLSPMGGEVIRGRRMMLRIAGPHTFIPGETVEILVDRPTWLEKLGHLMSRISRASATAKQKARDVS